MNLREFARYFDHTALKPETTPANIEQLCRETRDYGFAAVCVNPVYAQMAVHLLADCPATVCTVVGFPLGASTTASKLSECQQAIVHGAREIDMVIWIGGLKAGKANDVEAEIRALAEDCHAAAARLKVIIECALLTDEEKRLACSLAVHARADFVKTSTGFAAAGATVADVKLMSAIALPAGVGVKAAGGIRTFADATAMIAAGATRIGASASVGILAESRSQGMAE
ncbi:deoxyribose-phosphate aldolase [candidate division KSB1 bacterium]|nr:deoxyribose-phosphate aldolase [candidate division KSB1 bacterium]